MVESEIHYSLKPLEPKVSLTTNQSHILSLVLSLLTTHVSLYTFIQSSSFLNLVKKSMEIYRLSFRQYDINNKFHERRRDLNISVTVLLGLVFLRVGVGCYVIKELGQRFMKLKNNIFLKCL